MRDRELELKMSGNKPNNWEEDSDWVYSDGAIRCVRCGIPRELGAPNFGKWQNGWNPNIHPYLNPDILKRDDKCVCLIIEMRKITQEAYQKIYHTPEKLEELRKFHRKQKINKYISWIFIGIVLLIWVIT